MVGILKKREANSKKRFEKDGQPMKEYKVENLGYAPTFYHLAQIAIKNNEWRKIARLIGRANTIYWKISLGNKQGYIYHAEAVKRYYICRACLDTKISREAIDEIYKIYDLTSPVTRAIILSIKDINSKYK